MKKLIKLSLLFTLTLTTVNAFELNNVARNGARWRSYPINMALNPTDSGLSEFAVLNTIRDEMEKWNDAVEFTALAVSVDYGVRASTAMAVDSVHSIAFSKNFRADSKGFDPMSAVAVAGQYGDGYQMSDSFVLFNSEYVTWDSDYGMGSLRNSYRDSLPTIALHELGHVLGLGHSEVPNAVMAATRMTKVMTTLTQDDINGARYLTGSSTSGNGEEETLPYTPSGEFNSSGGCGSVTNGTGSSTGLTKTSNIGLNFAVILLPLFALIIFRKKALAISHL